MIQNSGKSDYLKGQQLGNDYDLIKCYATIKITS